MSIRRAVLAALVMAMVGFVVGVWFIGSGWGFQLIPVPSSATREATAWLGPDRPSPPPPPPSKAIGLPEFWNLTGGSMGLSPSAERSDLLPSPGCRWEVEPRRLLLTNDWTKEDAERILIGVPSVDPQTRRFHYYLTQLVRPGKPALTLRVVLFDAAGNRYRSRTGVSSSSYQRIEAFESNRHDWDDLPTADALGPMLFGVEVVVPNSDRLLAEAARAEAAAARVELPPPPRLGQPFPFDLATVDGGRVRAADFRGKAVLVTLWGPSPLRPTNLAATLRKDFPAADLAIVGISFSGDAAEAARDFKDIGEPAPLVLVPNDLTIRRLWREGAEVARLPAYWVVDRDGILRQQGRGDDLYSKVAMALGRPTQYQQMEAAEDARQAKEAALRKAFGGIFPPDTIIHKDMVYQLKPPPPGLGTPEHPMTVDPLPIPKAAPAKR